MKMFLPLIANNNLINKNRRVTLSFYTKAIASFLRNIYQYGTENRYNITQWYAAL